MYRKKKWKQDRVNWLRQKQIKKKLHPVILTYEMTGCIIVLDVLVYYDNGTAKTKEQSA